MTADDVSRITVPSRTGAAPRLYEQAADILAARIAQGVVEPGTRLLESHVADQFGISRAPARQALSRLAAMGLLTRSKGRGYVVAAGSVRVVDADAALAQDPVHLSQEQTWERIYKEVEQEIVARAAFCSWRVLEKHLAAFYGVSRTVAREVIARLHQRGVVKKRDGGRWIAPGLTRDYVAELYEMRWVLEPVALAAAAPNVPPAFVAELRRHLEEASARAHELDGPDLSELETEMHVRLLSYCGNGTLLEAIGLYQSLLIAHTFLYRWTPRIYDSEPFLPEHLEVAQRLEAGRVTEAAKAMEDHLRRSLDRAVGRLDVVRHASSPGRLPYLEPL
jgi:DNA-binding GntR family transcriptional regulator